MELGIRELRDGLSRHLARVRTGQTITVTDHGRAVARIIPVQVPSTFERLVADGVIEPARSQRRSMPKPVTATGSVSDLVGDQRR